MFAIENELGRFEAETEKEAKYLLSVARKEEAKKRKQRDADADIAMLRAKDNWYRVISRKIAGEDCPRGWRLLKAGQSYSPATVKFRDSFSYGRVPMVTWYGDHGTAESDHYGYAYLGCVSNGAGFPMAVFLEDMSDGDLRGNVTCLAIGIQGDQIRFLELPVTMDFFASVLETCE